MQQIPLRRIGAPRSVPAAAAAGMRVTEVRKAGWHIKRRPKEAEVYQLLRPTEKAYDALDRVIRTVLPGGSYDEYSGTGKRVQKVRYGITDEGLSYTETTDPKGNIGVQYTDARGNIVKVERYSEKDTVHPLTSATYEYDAMGQMVAAYDAARNPITVCTICSGGKRSLRQKTEGQSDTPTMHCTFCMKTMK